MHPLARNPPHRMRTSAVSGEACLEGHENLPHFPRKRDSIGICAREARTGEAGFFESSLVCCGRLWVLGGQTCCAGKVIEGIAVGAGCRAQWWRRELVGELGQAGG
ncbi:MAG: hypothetical protein JWR37_248 [Mycobacterium sp.]|nr:hypothetical protein [Mycobacterium sp.]